MTIRPIWIEAPPLAGDERLAELRAWIEECLAPIPDLDELDLRARRSIRLAVCLSVTSLRRDKINRSLREALDAGVSIAQVEEIMALVSGLGVHSIMATADALLDAAEASGQIDRAKPLDDARRQLWNQHVGKNAYWEGFSVYFPGFLDALLRLSPDLFVGVIEYCALPWKSRSVPAVVKELAAVACDATPSHIFLPGLRLHIDNAVKLGAGKLAIMEAIDVAASAPAVSLIE